MFPVLHVSSGGLCLSAVIGIIPAPLSTSAMVAFAADGDLRMTQAGMLPVQF